VSDLAHTLMEIREAIRSLEHRIDARFEAIERRIDVLE